MRIANTEIPCGCAERKEIMFGRGQPSDAEVLVPLAIGTGLFVMAAVWAWNRT